MIANLCKRLLLLTSLYLSPYLPLLSTKNPIFPLKCVNLGGWLVFEGPFNQSFYDGIVNEDLLDGARLQMKAVKIGRYLRAIQGGGDSIIANQIYPESYETHHLWRVNDTTFQIKTDQRWFWSLNGTNLAALSKNEESAEMFEIIRNPLNKNRIRIKAPNGYFLQAISTEKNGVTADFDGETDWSDNDPSVFDINIAEGPHSDYQLANGYGLEKATKILKEHWETFITEEDFNFMAENGLNGVRIPVPWWIAYDPPPKPYVGGSLNYLDKAFNWANKYGLKIVLDLHAVHCSQNGYDHTGTRDGIADWGSDGIIKETIDVIEFLAARYTKDQGLIAISLLNEPLAPNITHESLRKYYIGAYNVIRKYSSSVYVIMEGRIGAADPTEFYSLASSLDRVVVDLHMYNLYDPQYDSMTAQDNIDFVYTGQAEKLASITKNNGPLSFVGEWTDIWEVKNATEEDYKRYANAQLEVFGRATFGWAFWSLKPSNDKPYWSMEWLIKNGYIKL